MPLFRKNIRNHPRPLQQFANRLKEKSNLQFVPKLNEKLANPQVSFMHKNGPVPEYMEQRHYRQYKKYECRTFTFKLDNCNNSNDG